MDADNWDFTSDSYSYTYDYTYSPPEDIFPAPDYSTDSESQPTPYPSTPVEDVSNRYNQKEPLISSLPSTHMAYPRDVHPGVGKSRIKRMPLDEVMREYWKLMANPVSDTDLDTMKIMGSLKEPDFDKGFIVMPAWCIRAFRNDNQRYLRPCLFLKDLSIFEGLKQEANQH